MNLVLFLVLLFVVGSAFAFAFISGAGAASASLAASEQPQAARVPLAKPQRNRGRYRRWLKEHHRRPAPYLYRWWCQRLS